MHVRPTYQRLQFRLRTLLCAVAAVAVCLALWRHYQKQCLAASLRRELAEQLVAYGGKVLISELDDAPSLSPWTPETELRDVAEISVDYAEPESRPFNHYRGGECRGAIGHEIRFERPPRPDLALLARFPELRRLKVDSLSVREAACLLALNDLEELRLNQRSWDKTPFRHLLSLKNLRRLSLGSPWDTSATEMEAELEHVGKLVSLEELDLSNNPVNDEGLRHLGSLKQIRHLRLDHTLVTDNGLRHLAGLDRLHVLRLDHTQVTDAGLQQLQALPNLTRVDLSSSRVQSLDHLASAASLQMVIVEGLHLSDEAEDAFLAARPGVVVERNYGERFSIRHAALDWFSRHQSAAGNFVGAHDASCPFARDEGASATALNVLLFLMEGEKYQGEGKSSETYRQTVAALLRVQDGHGRFGAASDPAVRINTQAACVLVLASLLKQWEQHEEACRRAADVLLADWLDFAAIETRDLRSLPGPGWLLLALLSARDAGLNVPDEALAKLEKLVDRLAVRRGGAVLGAGGQADLSLTAQAVLCRVTLNRPADRPPVTNALALLARNAPSWEKRDPEYWFFGAFLAHQLRLLPPKWADELRPILRTRQQFYGRERGSYEPPDGWRTPVDRARATALSVGAYLAYYRWVGNFLRTEPNVDPPSP